MFSSAKPSWSFRGRKKKKKHVDHLPPRAGRGARAEGGGAAERRAAADGLARAPGRNVGQVRVEGPRIKGLIE